MKLINCYIEGFGKLSHFSYNFKDGLNCIVGENGSGKTTLCAFIRAMLYGLGDNRRASLDDNDRKRYAPWQGGSFGGSLTVVHGGENYVIERRFGSKQSQDSCTLRRASDGRLLDINGTVGEMLLGVDRDSFTATLFIGEKSLETDGSGGNAGARISDMLGSAPRGIDAAQKLLRDRARQYEKRGGSGEIADTRVKIFACNEAIDEAKAAAASAEERSRELHDIDAALEHVRKEREMLQERRCSTVQDPSITRRQFLEDQIYEQSRRLDAIRDSFHGIMPTEEEIDQAERTLNLAEGRATQLKAPQSAKTTSARHKSGQTLPVIMLVISALMIAVGCAVGALLYPVAYGIAAAGGIPAIIGIIMLFSRGRAQHNEIGQRADAFTSIANTANAQAARELIGQYGEICDATVQRMRTAIRDYKYGCELLERLSTELATLRSGASTAVSSEVKGDKSIDYANGRIAELERRYALTEREYRESLDKAARLDELLANKAELERQLAGSDRSLRILRLTDELLSEASTALASKHIGTLRSSFSKYADCISTDAGSYVIDTELHVHRTVGSATHPSESFSRGYRELYALALRLALIDSVYSDSSMVVVLDDPFVSLDDKRCAAAKEMLKEIAKKRQLIYLTCSESRLP